MASLHTALSVLIVSVVAAFAPASGATAASLHVIHDFCAKANCTDGSVPYGEVIVADSDTLFGTTAEMAGQTMPAPRSNCIVSQARESGSSRRSIASAPNRIAPTVSRPPGG